jgi:large subunit ribosomal protein L24
MNKFKKGDNVIVISGSNKGKIGNIKEIKNEKVIVEGVNLKTIHKKPTQESQGQIVKIERPIHISNVSHILDGKPAKIKFVIENNSEGVKNFKLKERFFKKTNKKIN